MKNSSKKLFSLILASLLLASSFVSCSDNDAEETESKGTVASEQSSDSSAESGEAVEEDTGTHYYDDIAAVDYDGWQFGIASRPLSSTYWNNITVEDLNGDEWNDALYNRQQAIEDKFNITVKEEYFDGDSNVTGAVSKTVRAGLDDFSLAYRCYLGAMSMFSSGVAMAISDVPVIDLSKPYWDQTAQEDLTIAGKMWYAIGDIGVDQYESSLFIYYNGELLENNQITESPYDLYKEGKWTVEAMQKMMQTVANDANGDGAMTAEDDIIGLAGRVSSYLPVVVASGYSIFEYDDSTQTSVTHLADDIMVSIGEKCKEVYYDTNISLTEVDFEMGSGDLFKSGRLLFYSKLLGEFRLLRDNDDDYGVIPWPSYQENADGLIYTENPTTLLICAACQDEERLGTIIESFAAYTYDYVIDDYINRAVIGKGARDQQSAEVIRDSMSKRYYDPADAFDITTPNDTWETAIKKGTYASMYAKCEKVVNTGLKNLLDGLE